MSFKSKRFEVFIIWGMSNDTSSLGDESCFFLEVVLFKATDRALFITTIFAIVLNAIFSVVAVVGNSIILLVIIRTRALRTCSNFFLGNLVLSDLLVGAVVQPLFVVYKTGEALENYSCLVQALYATTAWLSAGVSFLTLTALNCERYIAIFAPLRYNILVKPRRVFIVSVFMWLFSLLLVSSRFYGLINIIFYVICCIIIVMSLVTFLLISIQIHRVVKRHRTQIASMKFLPSVKKQAQEASHARNVTWVTFIFFMCYLPNLAVMIAYTMVGYSVTLKTFYVWSDTLVFLNSSINPGVYCWRNKGLRKAVLKFVNVRQVVNSDWFAQKQADRRTPRVAVITDNMALSSEHNLTSRSGEEIQSAPS